MEERPTTPQQAPDPPRSNHPRTNPLLTTISHLLAQRRQKSTFRRLTPPPAPTTIDFSSNDYLSLSTSAALKHAYLSELATSPAFALGSRGSRLLDGNSAYAEALERDIAVFHKAEAGLLFNSGFEANAGVFASLPQKGDVVVYDELVHASVHDGMRLSRAGRAVAFKHNDVQSLEAVLRSLVGEDEGVRAGTRNVFVAVEAVYSMDGDVAPLVSFVEVVEDVLGQHRNGHMIVDEAHATGVVGEGGRGLVCEMGLEERVFARVVTFGKALGCAGAIVLSAPLARTYLLNYARPLIYTTATPFPLLAAIRTVYTFLASPAAPPLRQHLTHLSHLLHSRLRALLAPPPTTTIVNVNTNANTTNTPPLPTPTSPCPPPLLTIPPTPPSSPILPLFTTQPRSLATWCQDAGFMVRPIVAPTVPRGRERVRVCLHAGNTEAEVLGLVERVGAWVGRMEGVVGERARERASVGARL